MYRKQNIATLEMALQQGTKDWACNETNRETQRKLLCSWHCIISYPHSTSSTLYNMFPLHNHIVEPNSYTQIHIILIIINSKLKADNESIPRFYFLNNI